MGGDENQLPSALAEQPDPFAQGRVRPNFGERRANEIGRSGVELRPDITLQDVEVGDIAEAALIDDHRQLDDAVLGHHPGGLGQAGAREAERELTGDRLLDRARVTCDSGHRTKL